MYPASNLADAFEAASAAVAREEEEMRLFEKESDAVVRGERTFATVEERFTANQRREHGKVNSYNRPVL